MSTFDPTIDLARLQHTLNQTAPLPLYPGWYDPNYYQRPDPIAIHLEGMRLYDLYAFQRSALRTDQELLRMMRQGIFENDVDDLEAGILEDYISTALVDDYHLAVSIMAGIEPFFPLAGGGDELSTYQRQKRAACQWLYEAESRAHVRSGEMDTSILRAKLLLERGSIIERRVLNRFAETGQSPFITTFIDPIEVIPIWEGWKGLGRVYRVFSMSVRDICAEFGDLSEGQEKKIYNLLGKDITDEGVKCDVVEYWDRRWRCTTMAGMVLVPPTEHNYGEPPYTIAYGPLGEAKLLKLPSGVNAAPETFQQAMQYKTNTFIWSKKHPHLFNEAMMKRYVLAFQKLLYPAYNVSIDPNFKGEIPQADQTPNAMNKSVKGVMEYGPMPPAQTGVTEQVLMGQIDSQVQTGFAPPTAHGFMPDQANISGTANRASLSAGLHLHRPWIKSEQTFLEECYSLGMRMIRRFGPVVEYGEVGRYKPIMAPMSRPAKNDPPTVRLNRELLDKTGTDVTVRMVIKDKDAWVQMAQASTILNQNLQVPVDYLLPELFGIPYDDEMRERWLKEEAIKAMYRHPKGMELIAIPDAIDDELAESEGDGEQQRRWSERKANWERYITQPDEMKQQVEASQMQQQLNPPQQAPNMNPPTTEGVSLPDLGQGPGSVTGNQGGRTPLGVG